MAYRRAFPGIQRAVRAAVASGGGGGAITPSLVVEYVDASGTFQRTTVATDGSTTISGNAPFLVQFDARGTRLPTAYAAQSTFTDAEAYAFWMGGFRLNYGEARGTTWTYGQNNSRDEDFGAPFFGHTYENAGTYTTRLKIRDELGNETTVSLTVTTSSQSVTRTIPTSDGAWGSIVSGGHYQVNRGSDYSSFGTLDLRRVHNVLFSATGSGADPIFPQVNIGNESTSDLTTTRDRTRHCRFLNIDVNVFYSGLYGGLHCGVVNGRVRGYNEANRRAAYQNDVTTNTQRAQLMYPRGVFFYNTGLMNIHMTTDYLTICEIRGWHCQGVTFNRNTGVSNNHIGRNQMVDCSFRNNLWYASTPTHHFIKGAAEGSYIMPTDSDLVGPVDGSSNWYARGQVNVVYDSNQFGQAGDNPSAIAFLEIAPQNDSTTDPDELFQYVAFENAYLYWLETDSTFGGDRQEISLGGHNVGFRNVRHNMGAGAGVRYQTSRGPNRIPAGKDGPYVNEPATNSRPVPSAF